MVRTARYDSPIGGLLLAEEDGRLTGLWVEGQKYFPAALGEGAGRREASPVLVRTGAWLDRYFEGARPDGAELPLAPAGSPFRRAVWRLLCEIPYGAVTTYGEIAGRLAAREGRRSLSSQAVGGAVAHNPISIIIPCHRVVGANGSLTGYAGGLDRKIKLLEHEGADLSRLFAPKKGTAL